MSRKKWKYIAFVVPLALASCATVSMNEVAREATAQAYANRSSTSSVVILAVNWGRKWKCGPYENAEIMSLGFDRLPLNADSIEAVPEIVIDGPPRVLKKLIFMDYALLLEPGEYALTSIDIKVARSETDVGHLKANRSHLIEEGRAKGGSFDVKEREAVYIGNFFLDCYQQPIVWRYFTESRDGFNSHMAEVKQKYPFIDPAKVEYRLFKTSVFGEQYELPN